jgi:hypothetical protein
VEANEKIVLSSGGLKTAIMKKVFLLLGIASFSAASAQQKDVFDIQQHLDKMFKDKKIPEIVISPLNKPTPVSYSWPFPNNQKLSIILPNGDKVYILSQDNMPCVVPDMTQFNMPNVSNSHDYFQSLLPKNNIPGNIPNAAPFFLITPQVK